METTYAIEVQGLHKSYGDFEAVKGIDLKVKTGEIFALLGPNGAGKTTTIEILEGFLKPNAGHVRVLGYDPAKHERVYKEQIGIVLQETEVEEFLSVEESIRLVRSYYQDPVPLDDILAVTGLTDLRRTRPRKLSGGQKRRLDVAMGLAGNPELLFLDEPTTGFDPHARREAWDMLRNLRELGKTVLLTSHYMDEVEHIADRVAVMINGKIVFEGMPQELAHESEPTISFRAIPNLDLPAELETEFYEADSQYELSSGNLVKTMHILTGWAIENNVNLDELSITRRSLDDAFVELTRSAEEEER